MLLLYRRRGLFARIAFGRIKYSWDIESRVTDEMKTHNEKCTRCTHIHTYKYKQAKSLGAAKSTTKDVLLKKYKKKNHFASYPPAPPPPPTVAVVFFFLFDNVLL